MENKKYVYKWRLNNKEKYLTYLKQYRLKNKQKRKEYLLLNKEKIKKQNKQYYLNNKEKIIKYKKKYYLNNYEEKIKKYKNKYYLINKEKIIKYKKKYYLNNIKKMKKYYKLYSQKNRKKLNQYRANKAKNDPIFKLIQNQRRRIRQALKEMKKTKSTLKLLGCSATELWNHLEKQFKSKMTRKNYGKWHVDHIRPCASFDLTNPKQQQICFHYTNLQPLWAIDNIKKGAKLDYEME